MWPVEGLHDLGVKHFRVEYMLDCVLHCVDLGVAQRYIGESLKATLKANVFGVARVVGGCLMTAGMIEVGKDLVEYYRLGDLGRTMVGKPKMNRAPVLTLKKLGNLKWPYLHAKGAESRHLAQYATDLAGRLPGNRKCALLHGRANTC